MSIEDLTALKASYSGNRYFNSTILNTLVDEIIALNGRVEAKDAKIDELDSKIDALELRIDGYHP